MSRRPSRTPTRNPAQTQRKLVEATVRLMLRQGFAGTTVDEICAEAGVTKGSFFHHFESKEAIGVAAVEAWGRMGTALYAEAWADAEMDPLEQLHRMFEIMIGFTERPDEPCLCMVGMMSQELALTTPAMQAACAKELDLWTANTAKLLAAAKEKRPPVRDFDPVQIAWFLNSLWQGSMLVAKTRGHQPMTAENIRLARAWVDGVFGLN